MDQPWISMTRSAPASSSLAGGASSPHPFEPVVGNSMCQADTPERPCESGCLWCWARANNPHQPAATSRPAAAVRCGALVLRLGCPAGGRDGGGSKLPASCLRPAAQSALTRTRGRERGRVRPCARPDLRAPRRPRECGLGLRRGAAAAAGRYRVPLPAAGARRRPTRLLQRRAQQPWRTSCRISTRNSKGAGNPKGGFAASLGF